MTSPLNEQRAREIVAKFTTEQGVPEPAWEDDLFEQSRGYLERVEQENSLIAEVKEWLCDKCNYVYQGPPSLGFNCVVCKRCGGDTGPKNSVIIRRLKKAIEAADRMAENINGMWQYGTDLRNGTHATFAKDALKKYRAARAKVEG